MKQFYTFEEASDVLPFIGLKPSVLLDGWSVKNISVRPEGASWATLWFLVQTPTGVFRVKEFFQDHMEPTYPDTCVLTAQGQAFQLDHLTYWHGNSYKGTDCYVLSLWKTQVEISIDEGHVDPYLMESFLRGLEPIDRERAGLMMQQPFHELSFHARTGRGNGEIGRVLQWMSPEEANVPKLSVELPTHWVLESVGIGEQETQFVYWDPQSGVYSLWADRHQNRDYSPTSSWTRNYSAVQQVEGLEFYTHDTRGTVVYDARGAEQIAYVFRGQPCTTPEEVRALFLR